MRTQSTVVAWCALEEKGRARETDDAEEGWANALKSARRDADFEPMMRRGVAAGICTAQLRAASSVISGGGASALALRVERAAISARRRMNRWLTRPHRSVSRARCLIVVTQMHTTAHGDRRGRLNSEPALASAVRY